MALCSAYGFATRWLPNIRFLVWRQNVFGDQLTVARCRVEERSLIRPLLFPRDNNVVCYGKIVFAELKHTLLRSCFVRLFRTSQLRVCSTGTSRVVT